MLKRFASIVILGKPPGVDAIMTACTLGGFDSIPMLAKNHTPSNITVLAKLLV